ncbi:tubulin polyglutamylase TTLL5 isoform X2 [Labeo rohita]|uniref:tubulin polyglutamylase TTLL5 isoform X2 n=1 Tax=Labeo rohita TaxID=84645 RepID=UPI0021E2702F|nr:tubulin polyglutamylase TTLL5 isoform X2 [Labeo rohita]
MPAAREQKDESESSSEDELEKHPCIAWSGVSKRIPVLLFCAEAIVSKDVAIRSVGEKYNLAFKIVRTESRLVRGILVNHGFHEVHPNSNDFNLMWTGSHLKPYLMRSLQDFQKVNHFPRSYELTRKDRLYKNIQRMQQTHGFQNFHIVPQTFVLPAEYQEFSSSFSKDKGAWIIKPVASSRGRGIYLISNPSQIPLDENILVSRYISNPLLIDSFKFDVRLYVLVTSYDPVLIYLYEEGLARFATVKYDHATANIKNQFMHLTNYSVNKKSSDYVSCDDPEVEDYGNKWSMSAMLRYLRQEGKDTTLLMGQIEDLIIKAVLSAEIHIATACKMFVPHRCNCFELYGFDVLIDSNLKPWLLEVNLSPSLACDAPLDLKIKASMISDMFSLVGFVCQDPLLRQARPDRAGFDSRMKNPTQKSQRQRPPSANGADPEAQREKAGAKQAESTLGLTAEEMKVLRRVQEEYDRRGGFVRIFPTPDTWELYSGYLEYKTSMNAMLANKLFHGRSVISRSRNRVNDSVTVVVGTFYTHHVVQYERKLLSLEVRKQRRKPGRASAGRKRAGLKASQSPHMSEIEDGVEEETKLKSSHLHTNTTLEQHSKPRVNLLHILQQGWDLSKVQARMAFSSYLHRVQLRLLAESRANRSPAWTQKEHDQMELVVRFLKRASSNLRQDVCLEDPSPQLSLPDRQRILSNQLGNFIQLYNEETKQMVESLDKIPDEDRCINSNVFQEFILEASESDLEEVLTFYTQKNKSASVFLGTKCGGSRVERNSEENTETACINMDNSNGLDNTNAVSKTQNTDSAAAQTGDQGQSNLTRSTENCSEPKRSNKIKCNSLQNGHFQSKSQNGDCTNIEVPPNASTAVDTESRASQDGTSRTQTAAVRSKKTLLKTGGDQPYAAALECEQIVLQHCLPPPYIQPPPHPLANSSSSVTPPSVCVTWASARNQSIKPTAAQQINPTSVNTFVPRATHISIQRSSRPSSAGYVSQKPSLSTCKSRPGSAGLLKETDSLSAQAQSNQQAIVAALRKLVEKQAARQYSTSSHISLLTQHLTNLNLANGFFSKGGLTLSPGVRHGPVRAVHRDTTAGNSGLRAACEAESVCNVDPPGAQKQGNYQLQFAIQQLQQQKLRSRQLLNQSRTRQQAILSAHTLTPAASARPHAPSSPMNQPLRRTLHQTGSAGLLTLTPKPPSSAPRDGRVRKTVAHSLHKKALSEPPAGQGGTSGQHVVYDTVCAKTGLSVYSKLFNTQGSWNR